MQYLSSTDFASILFSNLVKDNYLEVYLKCCLLNKSWHKFCTNHLHNYLISCEEVLDAKIGLSIIHLCHRKILIGSVILSDILEINFHQGKIVDVSLDISYTYTRENMFLISASCPKYRLDTIFHTTIFRHEGLICIMVVVSDGSRTNFYRLIFSTKGLISMFINSYLFRASNSGNLCYTGSVLSADVEQNLLPIERSIYIVNIITTADIGNPGKFGHTKETWDEIKEHHRYIPKILHPIFE